MTGLFPWDQDEENQKNEQVNTVICGEHTKEEAEAAFDEMFHDSNYYLDKIMKGTFL